MSHVTLPSVEDLRVIITTSKTDAELEALIGDVALLLGTCIEPLEGERQAAIVKYATADLLASTPNVAGGAAGPLTQKSLGDASETYAGPSSTAQFGGSAYWRTALMLDPNGCLQRLGRRHAFFEKV